MPHTMKKERDHTEIGALIALFLGAVTIGAAGVLVRLAETGPMATAFWRGFFALPLLAVWAMLDPSDADTPSTTDRSTGNGGARVVAAGAGRRARRAGLLTRSHRRLLLFLRDRGFLWAGLFFAGDLVLWHESLLMTSVAAATLEACLAPLVVVLFAWLAWKERPTPAFLVAIALAVLGMVLIVSPKLGHGSSAFLGDAFGLATAIFFAGYILAVAHLRGRYGTGAVMFNSTVVFTVLLFPLALTQKYLPTTMAGWAGDHRLRGRGARIGAGVGSLCPGAPAADIQLVGAVGGDAGCGGVGLGGVGGEAGDGADCGRVGDSGWDHVGAIGAGCGAGSGAC